MPAAGDPRRRARLREGGQGAALLDARDHRAPQRGRQRLRPDQPGAPDGPRRPLGLGRLSRCAARTTCRAAATWARCRTSCRAARTSRTPSIAREVRARLEAPGSRRRRAGTCRRCSRRWSTGSCTRSTSSARTRCSRRPTRRGRCELLESLDLILVSGHVPDEDGRDRPRRPARGAPPGARTTARSPRASGASSACARRSIRPGRRAAGPRDPRRARPAARRRTSGRPTAEKVWDELRSLSPWHGGMSYRRLEELKGLAWPCPDESHPGSPFLHGRLWADPVEGPRAPFHAVEHDPPVDKLSEEFPIRLTTGRRLDSYNTGVQTAGYTSPLRRGEIARHRAGGRRAPRRRRTASSCARSRAAARSTCPRATTRRCGPGLAFMTLHFQDDVATNLLTIDATDPKSGTAEFKATAIRIEKLEATAAPRLEMRGMSSSIRIRFVWFVSAALLPGSLPRAPPRRNRRSAAALQKYAEDTWKGDLDGMVGADAGGSASSSPIPRPSTSSTRGSRGNRLRRLQALRGRPEQAPQEGPRPRPRRVSARCPGRPHPGDPGRPGRHRDGVHHDHAGSIEGGRLFGSDLDQRLRDRGDGPGRAPGRRAPRTFRDARCTSGRDRPTTRASRRSTPS